jgi:nucleoside-diphosphate-sugar epimerase
VLCPGDIVINLAYMSSGSDAENRAMMNNIVEACVSSRVVRLVHCSTAVVAGVAAQSRIFESTQCFPRLPYERTKWALEQTALSAVPRGLDVVVVRPTEIVGRGSGNLVKLARSLQRDNRIVSYLRASVLANRPMHLVPVRNVVTALIHVAMLAGPMNGNIYHICADEDPDNKFTIIEQVLSRALGLPARRVPLLPVPRKMLSLLSGLLGQSALGSPRIYDSHKLLDTGFAPIDSVASAVRDFGENYHAVEF